MSASPKYNRLVAEETLILAATEEICRVLADQEVSREELAKRMGVGKSNVSQLLSGDRNMTLRTLAHMAHVLDCKVEVAVKPVLK